MIDEENGEESSLVERDRQGRNRARFFAFLRATGRRWVGRRAPPFRFLKCSPIVHCDALGEDGQ